MQERLKDLVSVVRQMNPVLLDHIQKNLKTIPNKY